MNGAFTPLNFQCRGSIHSLASRKGAIAWDDPRFYIGHRHHAIRNAGRSSGLTTNVPRAGFSKLS